VYTPCQTPSPLQEQLAKIFKLSLNRVRVIVPPVGGRCLLMMAYATGLRVSELVRLKVGAIDSERMMVRVEQGKGRKDRYTILSSRLLTELRSYWKEHRSPIYLFPNRKGDPISIDYAQRIYNLAKLRAGIQKGHGIHTLRHCFCHSSVRSRGGSENYSDAVGP
jgi:site-specific recombinase XerD